MSTFDREQLGRLVRQVWIECTSEQPNPKPHHLLRWDELDEWNKEVDRRIGERIAQFVLVEMVCEQQEQEIEKLWRGENR